MDTINKKSAKLKNTLKELEDEIEESIEFLTCLKEKSNEMYHDLQNIKSSNDYLKDFSKINSFFMKSIGIVADVNCKFQILENEENIVVSDINLETSCKPDKEIKVEVNEIEEKTIKRNVGDRGKSISLIDFSSSSSENEDNKAKGNWNPYVFGRSDLPRCRPPGCTVPRVNARAQALLDSRLASFYSSILNGSVVNTNLESPKVNNSELKSTIAIGSSRTIPKEQMRSPISNNRSQVSPIVNNQSRVLPKAEDSSKVEFISPMKISKITGTEYEVVVEHIKSPGEFYVHFDTEEITKLVEMNDWTKTHNSELIRELPFHRTDESNVTRKETAIDILGDYALWFCKEDKLWCRVKITDWRLNEDDDAVTCHLIDYGDSQNISLSALQIFNERLKNYPVFASKCHLSGIYPLGSQSGRPLKEWHEQAAIVFELLLENRWSCKIRMAVDDGCYGPDSVPVELFAENENSINSLLVEYDHAVNLKIPPAPCSVVTKKSQVVNPDVEEWNPMKEDHQSYRNTYDLDADDPAAAIYGHVGKDYERACPIFNEKGDCFKGDACRKEHFKLDPSGFTLDAEPVYKSALNCVPPPPIDSIVPVQVTCILRVNEFYCLREIDESKIAADEETLTKLADFMNEEANVKRMKKSAVPPSVGEIVLGKFSGDGMFYRARVLSSQPEKDLYDLFFVDYGNSERVSSSNIRKMEPKYLHLPFQAIKCRLDGVGINENVPNDVSSRYLDKIIQNKNLKIRVVGRLIEENVHLIVKLYDENNFDIGNNLIANNYAIQKQNPAIHERSECLPG